MTERPRVKSDRTLFAILAAIRERGPVRVGEIASEVGVAKSTTHDHLSMLRAHDFVTLTDDGYDLGLRFLDYGLESRRRQELFELGREKVRELARRTGERAWCVVEEHGRAVYLYGASGERSIRPESTGARQPLHCLAAGKAIMAHLPDERVDAIVDEHGLDRRTERTITERDALDAALERVRERGVAYNLEEGLPDVNAVAAPVLDADGSVFGAISIGGPANRLTEERLESEYADLLRGATNEVAVNLRS